LSMLKNWSITLLHTNCKQIGGSHLFVQMYKHMMLSEHSDEWLGIGQTYLAYLV
jgi:hypothetical protein